MRIIFVTKRSHTRALEEIRRAVEDVDRAAEIAMAKVQEYIARHNRLMDIIWQAHDAGHLPAEVDSLLLSEWLDDEVDISTSIKRQP